MSTTTGNKTKGGEFLIKTTEPQDIYIPDELSEEQQMMVQACHDFLEQEVYPNINRIDAQEEGLMQSLLDKAGELGLLGISIPEEYDGLGKDFTTGMLVTEALGAGYSFSLPMRRTQE
jgi:alkylation response protein AidB-like acyl-CoA dehydrogenase